MKIFEQFGIPFIVLCDSDTLYQIKENIKNNGKKIKTSILFKQLQQLGYLDNQSITKIIQWESNLTSINKTDTLKAKISELINDINQGNFKFNFQIQQKLDEVTKMIQNTDMEFYHDSLYSDIQNELNNIIKNSGKRFNIKVLPSDFEGLFSDKKYLQIWKEAYDLYGSSKVLKGKHIGSKLSSQDIPLELNDLIVELKKI